VEALRVLVGGSGADTLTTDEEPAVTPARSP
jgi:hypothetical protein